jgi:hypothetical protein
MSDELSNATRIAALEDYNQRLLAENVRLSNEAAELRAGIEDARRYSAIVQCHWDRERERCGVLEAEVKAWHAAEGLRKNEPHNEFMRLAEARFKTRETHALDAEKFVGGAD